VARVDGNLAVSRAIGDMQYKQYLIADPETDTHTVHSDDDVLLLSTDGLFMVFSEEQVAAKVHEMRMNGVSCSQIAKNLVSECCTHYQCKDNVTVLVIDLRKHLEEYRRRSQIDLTHQKRQPDFNSFTDLTQMPFDVPAQKRYLS
jgi:serine/threonine protein phosphatase PrpC